MTLKEYESFLIEETEKIVEEIHNIDYVEVIRCRDCIFYKPTNESKNFCNIGMVQYARDEDYCSKARRKGSKITMYGAEVILYD